MPISARLLVRLLADERLGRETTVARLTQLAAVEREALTGEIARPEDVRMHAPGVALGRF